MKKKPIKPVIKPFEDRKMAFLADVRESSIAQGIFIDGCAHPGCHCSMNVGDATNAPESHIEAWYEWLLFQGEPD